MSQKRQNLVDTAIELFARDGFHGTGIDRIAQEAGVSKKTMYQHFRSKEELILAALKHQDGLGRNQFMKSVNDSGASPTDRLLAIFDFAHEWFRSNSFFGCIFINAVGEYSAPGTAIRKACQSYKEQVTSFIEELANEADLENPAKVATSLSLLLEGAIVTAQVSGDPDSATTARAVAQLIIDDARRPRSVEA